MDTHHKKQTVLFLKCTTHLSFKEDKQHLFVLRGHLKQMFHNSLINLKLCTTWPKTNCNKILKTHWPFSSHGTLKRCRLRSKIYWRKTKTIWSSTNFCATSRSTSPRPSRCNWAQIPLPSQAAYISCGALIDSTTHSMFQTPMAWCPLARTRVCMDSTT